MTATYLRKGQGKSDNAYYAESCGLYPLTRGVKIISQRIKPYYRIPQKTIREWLELQGPSEWHHVGKYASNCDYYDTEPLLELLLHPELLTDGEWDTNLKNEPIFWGNTFLELFE